MGSLGWGLDIYSTNKAHWQTWGEFILPLTTAFTLLLLQLWTSKTPALPTICPLISDIGLISPLLPDCSPCSSWLSDSCGIRDWRPMVEAFCQNNWIICSLSLSLPQAFICTLSHSLSHTLKLPSPSLSLVYLPSLVHALTHTLSHSTRAFQCSFSFARKRI